MSFERVFLRQRFRAERDYLVDWCWIALLAVVFLPWPVHGAFPVLAVIFGSGLAVRFGGYPTRTRSWEYLLTRSISRERLVRALFLAMALPIVAFCLFGAVADAVHLRDRVFALFVPSYGIEASPFLIPFHLLGAALALLMAAHVFHLAVGEPREDSLPNVRVNGLITGVLLYGIALIATSALGVGVELERWSRERLPERVAYLFGQVPGLVVIGAAVWLNLRFAVHAVRRRELAGREFDAQPSGRSLWLVAIIVALVAFGTLIAWFLSPKSEPLPADLLPREVMPRSSGK